MSKSNQLFMDSFNEYEQFINQEQAVPEGEPLKEKVMPTVDEIYPSKNSDHIKADDLKGHEVKAKIASYEIADFSGDKKVVLTFSGKDKTLVMNKTNSKTIAGAFGDDIDGWIDKEINLYPSTTQFDGKDVPCIRVRPELPKADEFDQDIPF